MATKKEATAQAEPKHEEKAEKAPEGLPSAKPDGGAAQVQAKVDQEEAQGFRGVEVDPTPNEAYTLQGVTSGAPTPETDPAAAKKADERHEDLSGGKFAD